MKKLFSLMFALVAVLAINARQVVFDFSTAAGLQAMGLTAPANDGEATVISGQSIVLDGVTFSNVKVAKTDTRVWNSKGNLDLRIYSTSTMTFAADENITAIEFAGSAIGFNEFSGKTWTGNDMSVTFTASMTCKITTITLTIGEAANVWVPDTISATEAIALAQAGDTHDHFVIGVVRDQPFCTYTFKDKVSFWMNDAANANDTIEFYDGLGLNGAKWASLEEAQLELRIGDTILVYAGGLSMYTPKGASVAFAEITGGYYAEKLGANPDAPDPIIVGPDTVTTAEAIAIAQELSPAASSSASTSKEYVVKGFIVAASSKYEKTWYMADEPGVRGDFQAFKCDSIDREVNIGDYVYVRGKIQNYNGGTYNNYEISYGILVHGEGPKIDTIEVNVAQALAVAAALDSNAVAEGIYKVRGLVSQVVYEFEDGVETFYMVDALGSADKFYAFKAKLDKAVAVGDEVVLVGKIQNYKDPVKSILIPQIGKGTVIEINGEKQGIENIVLTEQARKVMVEGQIFIIRDNKLFNLQGARVR